MIEKDIFVIYSSSNRDQVRLAQRVKDDLWHGSMDTYEYEDFEWEPRGPDTYSSQGSRIDPVRFAMRHPEPFIRSGGMEINSEWLEKMFDRIHAVVILNEDRLPAQGMNSDACAVGPLPPSRSSRPALTRQAGMLIRPWSWIMRMHRGRVPGFWRHTRGPPLRPVNWLVRRDAWGSGSRSVLPNNRSGSTASWHRQGILRGPELDQKAKTVEEIVAIFEGREEEVSRWHDRYAYVFDAVGEVMRSAEQPSPVWHLSRLATKFVMARGTQYERSEVDWLVRSNSEARTGKWRYLASSALRVANNPESSFYWVARLHHAVGSHWFGRRWDVEIDLRTAAETYDAIIDERQGEGRDMALLFRGLLAKEAGDIDTARHCYESLLRATVHPRVRFEAALQCVEIARSSRDLTCVRALTYITERVLSMDPWELRPHREWDPRPAIQVRCYDDLLRASGIFDDQEARHLIERTLTLHAEGDVDAARDHLRRALELDAKSDGVRASLSSACDVVALPDEA